MPYKYIGKPNPYKGNTLFELFFNLKNFGVGRLITRGTLKKHPEPSYFIVRKVIPQVNTTPVEPDLLCGRVWVEEVFRGRKLPGLQDVTTIALLPDYFLVPKHEEEVYLNYKYNEEEKIVPKYYPLPPLLSQMMKKQLGTKEEPQMEMLYSFFPKHYNYRVANKGEIPNVDLKVKLFPQFLVGIKEI